MKANAISAVLFDLGGVLVQVDSSQSFIELAEILGSSPDELRAAMRSDLLTAYEKGEITSDEFYIQLQARCDGEGVLSQDAFRSHWQNVLFPNHGMIQFLKRVTEHYPVWFLSNTNQYHYDILMADFEFMRLAKGGIYSFLEGTMKPEARIYEITKARIPFPVESILFIDDLEENIAGARQAGFATVLFKSREDLCEQLKSRYPDVGENLCA